jgi:hypothetical protein
MIRLNDEQWERIRKHFPEEHIADDRPGRKPVPHPCASCGDLLACIAGGNCPGLARAREKSLENLASSSAQLWQLAYGRSCPQSKRCSQ